MTTLTRLFFPLTALISQLSWATTFLPVPFPNRVQDAPNIVRGTVGSQRADWAMSRDGKKRIYTYTEIQIEEVFKGPIGGRTLSVRELGGQKDGIGLEIPGTAKFRQGEDVVLMLGEENPDRSYDVKGMMTGKFNVHADEDGKETLEGGMDDDHAPSAGKSWTVADLRQLVRDQKTSPLPPLFPTPTPAPKSSPLASPSVSQSASPETRPVPVDGALTEKTIPPSEEEKISASSASDHRTWFILILGVVIIVIAVIFLRPDREH